MVYGIGIDIVKIGRMREVVEKWGTKFLTRVFTRAEIAYCSGKKDPFLSYSVRFAAKEALIKAIGSEVPVSLQDIEVVNVGGGKPLITAGGRLAEFFREKGITSTHLSLSHEKEYGVACVVLEAR